MPDPASLETAIREHLRYSLAVEESDASREHLFTALALALRRLAVDGMLETQRRFREEGGRRVYWLSMEYLLGRALRNTVVNLRLEHAVPEALRTFGADFDDLCEVEADAALGQGTPARLAACVLDSLATLGLAGYGYGLNYEYGLFRQEIRNGRQKEKPDHWLANGSPWLIERPHEACFIPTHGIVHETIDRDGQANPMWLDWQLLVGVPHDLPVVGYGGETVTFLRLFSARASNEFDMEIFNSGDYVLAAMTKMASETVSKVLYPPDAVAEGRELRLMQEYFFVACAVRDIVRRHLQEHDTLENFADRVAIQLNGTQPALAVAELARYLVDEAGLPWERAWEQVQRTFGCTCHAIRPSDLGTWSLALVERVLPRHVQILREIDRRFLEGTGIAIVEEDGKRVHAARLAVAGSHAVSAVVPEQARVLRDEVLADLHARWPDRFRLQTNGATPRRWLLAANPGLAALVTAYIGEEWIADAAHLAELEAHVDDPTLREGFWRVRRANRERLARVARETTRTDVDPDSLFDVQATRIHADRRQLLHVLFILLRAARGGSPAVPRTHVFAGKAPPGDETAKRILRLIHVVADVVNRDERLSGTRVVFLPDFRVSLAERVLPGADLAEQLAVPGTQACSTGTFKLALNGALTLGARNATNLELEQRVGASNAFLFERAPGDAASRLADALDAGILADEDELALWLKAQLREDDRLADLDGYLAAQAAVEEAFLDQDAWATRALRNVARAGWFSSDRTVLEYARDVWHVKEPAAVAR